MSGVGFARSTNRAAADSAKKRKHRAAIPTTPAIAAKVAEIRANNGGDAGERQNDPAINSGVNSDTSIVAEMKLVRARKLTDYTVTSYREIPVEVEAIPVNGYVPFEGRARVLSSYTTKRGTWFQVEAQGKRYIVGEWLVAGVVPPSPLPEKVEIIDIPLLPEYTETHLTRFIQRVERHYTTRSKRTVTPLVIELYANTATIAGYLPARTKDNLKTVFYIEKQAARREWEQEHGEKLPDWKPPDVGKPQFWMRNPDGTLEKRCVS